MPRRRQQFGYSSVAARDDGSAMLSEPRGQSPLLFFFTSLSLLLLLLPSKSGSFSSVKFQAKTVGAHQRPPPRFPPVLICRSRPGPANSSFPCFFRSASTLLLAESHRFSRGGPSRLAASEPRRRGARSLRRKKGWVLRWLGFWVSCFLESQTRFLI